MDGYTRRAYVACPLVSCLCHLQSNLASHFFRVAVGLFQTGFSKESLLLHATKQLNAGAELIADDWERMDLADLNYQSAELAARNTSFNSAVEYLQMGIDHLRGVGGWAAQYDRTLRFQVALARMQFSCGLLEDCWNTTEEVVRHGKNFGDLALIHRTRVLCLMQNDLLDDALQLVLHVLDTMDEPVPRRFMAMHALRGVLKARQFLRETSDEDFLNMPTVVDEHVETYQDFLQYHVSEKKEHGPAKPPALRCCSRRWG